MANGDLFNTVAEKYGLDPDILRRFAQIESGGNPLLVNKHGYSGLFQLSPSEFQRHGSGDILNPEANADAAGAVLRAKSDAFARKYGRQPTASDLYLMHQQGEGGAAAHMAAPDASAWQNMASTLEGRQKGPEWAKRAIWGNIPDSAKSSPGFNKEMFPGGVDDVTSADFMAGWKSKVEGGTMPSTPARLTASKLRERYGSTPAVAPQVIEQVAPDAELATSGGGGSIIDRLAAVLGGGSGTPADRLADARRMIEAGRSATIASPWQLAGSLAQQGVGHIKEYYANKDQKNMDAALTQALTGGGASNPAALARTLIASGNPQYRNAGIEMLAKSMTPRQDEWIPSPDGAVVVNKATGEVRDTGRQNLKMPRIVTVKDPETGYDVSAEVLPDGSMRRLDPNALPGARQPAVTGAAGAQPSAARTAPVMPKVLRDALLRKDAEAMDKYRESAGEASNLAGSIDELEAQRAKTNFEGSWWNNPLTRTIGRNIGGGGGIIPTSEEVAALDAMAAPSTAMQLGFTSKTKGAVSDREMALFANAVPDANMTDEAARGVIDAQRAVLQRAEEKANFYENWLATQGSGRGFQQAWSKFTHENPVIQTDANGNIVANKENVANWQRYLNPAAAVTPGVGTAERPPETAPQPEANAIPQAAIDYLKTNPAMRDQFDAKYGAGAASRILGE